MIILNAAANAIANADVHVLFCVLVNLIPCNKKRIE